MKTKNKLATLLGIAGLATGALAGPFIVIQPPTVVVSAPPPVVVAPAVTVGVPDSYVWDGYEDVGLVGGQYYYLGPNHVWLAFDDAHRARFNGWARNHADWRTHATVNVNYRADAHGHNYPYHDPHAAPAHDDGHGAPQHYDGHDTYDHHDGH